MIVFCEFVGKWGSPPAIRIPQPLCWRNVIGAKGYKQRPVMNKHVPHQSNPYRFPRDLTATHRCCNASIPRVMRFRRGLRAVISYHLANTKTLPSAQLSLACRPVEFYLPKSSAIRCSLCKCQDESGFGGQIGGSTNGSGNGRQNQGVCPVRVWDIYWPGRQGTSRHRPAAAAW